MKNLLLVFETKNGNIITEGDQNESLEAAVKKMKNDFFEEDRSLKDFRSISIYEITDVSHLNLRNIKREKQLKEKYIKQIDLEKFERKQYEYLKEKYENS